MSVYFCDILCAMETGVMKFLVCFKIWIRFTKKLIEIFCVYAAKFFKICVKYLYYF